MCRAVDQWDFTRLSKLIFTLMRTTTTSFSRWKLDDRRESALLTLIVSSIDVVDGIRESVEEDGDQPIKMVF